jgi:hypothetical protein
MAAVITVYSEPVSMMYKLNQAFKNTSAMTTDSLECAGFRPRVGAVVASWLYNQSTPGKILALSRKPGFPCRRHEAIS